MLSDKQETLLKIAVEDNKGRITIGLAKNLYSSKNTAKNAVTTLQTYGFLERIAPGTWQIVKLPPHIKKELTNKEPQPND